jgi:hypothetical protein
MRLSLARHRGVGDVGRSVVHGGPRPVLARTPAGVLALQRMVGNRAVASMLENDDELFYSQLIAQALGVGQAGGAAAAGAAGAASAGAAGAHIDAGPDPDLIDFDLEHKRKRSAR